jgi:hypothetical protein
MVSERGLLDIYVPNGGATFNVLSAYSDLILDINGGMSVNDLTGGILNLTVPREGGRIVINKLRISKGVNIKADNIFLGDVFDTTSANPLRFNISGNDGWLADTVNIRAHSDTSIIFDKLFSNYANIDALSRLILLNTLIGTRAQFTSLPFRVIVDNVNKNWLDYNVQLYMKDRLFYLYFPEDGKTFSTNAFVVQYDDNFTINGFSTENSIARLIPKLLFVAGYPNEEVENYRILNMAWMPWSYAPGTGYMIFNPSDLGVEDENSMVDENDVNVIRE